MEDERNYLPKAISLGMKVHMKEFKVKKGKLSLDRREGFILELGIEDIGCEWHHNRVEKFEFP